MQMANTDLGQDEINVWYLVTSCNNHITLNKEWFIRHDKPISRSIRFADNRKVIF